MAREEHPREDLLRDARNLTPRAQFQLTEAPDDEPVFCGFRGKAISFYFGEDPVYHFNPQGELRRAYVDGRLLKAEDGRLVSMRRQRTETTSTLARRNLAPDEAGQLLATMTARLAAVRRALIASAYELHGEVPADAGALLKTAEWLAKHETFAVAQSPRVGD